MTHELQGALDRIEVALNQSALRMRQLSSPPKRPDSETRWHLENIEQALRDIQAIKSKLNNMPEIIEPSDLDLSNTPETVQRYLADLVWAYDTLHTIAQESSDEL